MNGAFAVLHTFEVGFLDCLHKLLFEYLISVFEQRFGSKMPTILKEFLPIDPSLNQDSFDNLTGEGTEKA